MESMKFQQTINGLRSGGTNSGSFMPVPMGGTLEKGGFLRRIVIPIGNSFAFSPSGMGLD